MPANPLQVAEALVTTIRNFASDDNYKAIAGVFDEIPLLKGQIKSKDTELGRLRKEISNLQTRHENRLKEELELYRTQHNKLEEEKSKLSRDISTLTTTIQRRDGAVAELNRTQEGLQGQLDLVQKSLNEEKEKVAAANTAITKLQQGFKAKDTEIDRLKESLRNEKSQVSNTESQLQAIHIENTSLKQNLQSMTTRLNELEGFATRLHEQDETIWINRLDELWESARRLVKSFFEQDLPEDSLEDLGKSLKGSQLLGRPIPLPRSNSLAAKQMRIAAMLAILARCINQQIFQPTYILDEDDEEIRALLVRLAVANSRKESFCRALLLSIDPEEQVQNASKRVERVVREVAWYVRDLPSVAQYDSFRSGLEQVVQQACEIWQVVQHAREKFEPYFTLNHYDDFRWQPLRFEGGEQGITGASEGDEEFLVIVPRIYSIEDNEPDPVTNGVVLMKSQLAAAAEEEVVERRKPSSPTAARRNKSISLNGGNVFLPQSTSSGTH